MPKKKGKKGGVNLKSEELKRELQYGRHTLKKAEKEWKKLGLTVAVPRMREDVLNCSHHFDKIIQFKDYETSIYMDELRNQEDLYRLNLQSHQESIEKLMLGFFNHLAEIHEDNDKSLMKLIQASLDDWQNQMCESENSENYIKTMEFGIEMKNKRWIGISRMENFARMNEISSKHHSEQQDLTLRLETKLEGLWKRIKSVEESYWQSVEKNRKRNDVLKEADIATNKNIQKNLKKLMNLNELTKLLAAKYNDLVGTIGKKLEHLVGEREHLRQIQIALRSKLHNDRVVDQANLTLSTVEFSGAFEHLNGILKRGEAIIKLLAGLRKYELSQEKILPYPNQFYGKNHEDKFTPPEMALFWKRVAQVDANRYTLNEERIYLKMENEKLSKKIHSFCQCLQCPANPPIPNRAGKIPYTEGREMIKKNKTQNEAKDIDEDFV